MAAPTRTLGALQAERHRLRFDATFPLLLSRIALSIDSSQTPNYHDYLEVTLIDDGRGTFHAGKRSYAVSPGDIVLITADEFHYLETARGSGIHVTCVFFLPDLVHQPGGATLDDEYLLPFVRRGRGFDNRIAHSHATARTVRTHVHEMLAEADAGRDDHRLALKTRVFDMLFALSRHYRGRMRLSHSEGKRRREV